ncbi:MAG: PAS domain-containing protein, partial [Acidobacteria bacterium]|nr:PAS domain-containing protein [Acidobacteriota bacterium]
VSLFRRMRIRASLCAPLQKQGKPVAVLSVHSATPRVWTHDERELVLAVASRCWESIERAKSEAQLAQSEERLQQVFAQAPVAIVVFRGRDLVVEMANPHYEALVQNRAMVGRPLREILPELGSHVFDAFDQVLETGEPFVANDFHIAYDDKADGVISDHWFDVVYHPLRERDGGIRGVVAVCSNVTAQVVARRQLECANRELEEFAYVASHDLQEPLRMIGIYAQLLTSRYLGDDVKAQDYAGFIRKGVTRMEQLIDDLLSFSRTIHAEDVAGEADLRQSLDVALETLGTRIAETGAAIVVAGEQLPRVRGDVTQLALVFQNLLSNSLKYARADVAPRIEIAVNRTSGGNWTLSFTDNGIGFEQIYAERIFGLFKRLHKDAYAGTGLGLAICQRVVSRYGGSMRAEGRPGEGSTFFVSLPAL